MLAQLAWGSIPTWVTPGDHLAHYGPGLLALENLAAFVASSRSGAP